MRLKSITHPMAERGGSAILNAWKAGREVERAARSPAAQWGPAPQQARLLRAPPTASLRRFMAASNDRLVSDMADSLGIVSGNAEVRMSLRTMRARSRRLAKDNEYVKHFLHLLRNNVPGPKGFSLQMKIRKRNRQLDKDANAAIEEGYEAFSKQGTFTACGRLSRGAFERAAITCAARDGEVLIERLIGRMHGKWGMAYQLIDPDLLDDALNVGPSGAMPGYGRLAAGHSIRMGVEINEYGRAVAYWFFSVHPGDDVAGYAVMRHRRVEADRIIHWFLTDELRPGITRGIPWIYAAIRRMAMLSGYEEAALVSARQGASKMGFYKPPAAEEGGPNIASKVADNGDDVDDDDADPAADLYQEAEPGVFGVLPPGWDFQTYDPAYPNDAMAGFVKGMLRAFSSGVGLNYNTLASDYEGVNLSSMRHAALNDRDTYEALQQSMTDGVCLRMFEPWLELGLDLGKIGRLPADGFERFNKPRLIARPWRSPDPQKDVAAGAQKVKLGTTSRTRLCAEEGTDFEEILDELAEEEAMAKAKGVTLDTDGATASKNPPKSKPGGGSKPKPSDEDDETDEEGEDDATSGNAGDAGDG